MLAVQTAFWKCYILAA